MFRERIASLMRQYELTKADFANSISVSKQTIINYMEGGRMPSADVLIRIAQKYNVSVDWLLGLADMRAPDRDFQNACVTLGISEKAGEMIREYSNGETKEALNLYLDIDQIDIILSCIKNYIKYNEAYINESRTDRSSIDTSNPLTLGVNGYALMPLDEICHFFCEKAAKLFEDGLLAIHP